MGMDSTPRSGNHGPDEPESAPRLFLLLVVMIVVLGGLGVLSSVFGWGRAL
jgi:hypothetical protein